MRTASTFACFAFVGSLAALGAGACGGGSNESSGGSGGAGAASTGSHHGSGAGVGTGGAGTGAGHQGGGGSAPTCKKGSGTAPVQMPVFQWNGQTDTGWFSSPAIVDLSDGTTTKR
ncbi:MAG TPA: hypothetical protein VHB21_06875, partial [Minicystis sp.]|nr:hypothetical protein [Minicystis sp.]